MSKLKFLHGKNLNEDHPVSSGTFYLDLEKNELWYDDPSGQDQTKHIRLFDKLFSDIYEQLDDLNYKKISINSFRCTNAPTSLQKGTQVVGDLRFEWSATKIPEKITLNGTPPTEDPTETFGILISQNQSFGSKKVYTLLVEDKRTMDDKKYPNLNGASSTVTFNFNDPIFYGAIPKGSIINSKLLNTTGTITKALKSSIKGATYDINCGGASDNLVSIIAYPASWGDISMTVNGLGVQWLKTTIDYTSVAPSEIANNGLLSFTPQTTPYTVYYGTNTGLGALKVVVS